MSETILTVLVFVRYERAMELLRDQGRRLRKLY